jgi:hypothetical protein
VKKAAKGPWAPYRPTDRDLWDLRKVAHLHRRAGFGPTRAELLRDLKAGPAASVDRLLKPPANAGTERVAGLLARGARHSGDSERLKGWWLFRILHGADPLREKMTLFWHNHFATSNAKVNSVSLMFRQNELFRRHALGRFADLLTGVIADPAMLIWLDGAANRKGKPNENLAREFLELFTLGIGHYREADVRAVARAFTGWAGDPEAGFRFHPSRFDSDVKTFLKQRGAWKRADVVRITLEQPAAAEFLCRKLYTFLVSEQETPAPALIRPLADELRRSRYSIAHVVGIILRSRHFYGPAAYRQRVKGPVEFSAGLVRALEPAERINPLTLALACERQGQELFYPPSVKGWDGGRGWINSASLLQRGNWASQFVWGNPDYGLARYDPAGWVRAQRLPPARGAAGLVDLLLQNDLSAKARALILRTGRGASADALRKAVQLALHCPEYHLA